MASAPSSPTPNSSPSTSSSPSLKRKRSEDTTPQMSIKLSDISPPPPLSLPASDTSADPELDDSDEQSADAPVGLVTGPPSPVPTELDEPGYEVTQEDHIVYAKSVGVKIRDFVDEPSSVDLRAPEVWFRPRLSLMIHDMYVRAGPSRRAAFQLSGKILYRLRKTGWVTEEEVAANWTAGDRAAADAYEKGGPHPFIFPPVKKPTKEYRERLRLDAYGEPHEGDIPEDQIYMPEDEPGMDEGFPLPELGPIAYTLQADLDGDTEVGSENGDTEDAEHGDTGDPEHKDSKDDSDDHADDDASDGERRAKKQRLSPDPSESAEVTSTSAAHQNIEKPTRSIPISAEAPGTVIACVASPTSSRTNLPTPSPPPEEDQPVVKTRRITRQPSMLLIP